MPLYIKELADVGKLTASVKRSQKNESEGSFTKKEPKNIEKSIFSLTQI